MSFQRKLMASMEARGHRAAIEDGRKAMSYDQLLKAADKVTAFLCNRRIPKETIIGIRLEDRCDIISTLIGVINARCVFVLLDPSLPVSRQETMIRSLNLEHMIVAMPDTNRTGGDTLNRYVLEDMAGADGEGQAGAIQYPAYDPEDSLYIYFTSGSTGTPKAVVGKNASLLQFIEWEIREFGIDEYYRCSQFISPYFDAFLRDVFVPLFSGGTICIPPDEILIPWLNEAAIHLIHCVPSLFRVINSDALSAADFPKLRYVLMSGERINPSELIGWYKVFGERIQLVNLYGTTETTMIRSFYRISPEDARQSRIPIGGPIADTELLIVKDGFVPCNVLVPGDLYIVSKYVTKGYLNAPELTAERFIPLDAGTPNQRVAYKTGDKARRLPDGKIELLGREDRQIKLRGIRIEPEEIETALMRSGRLKSAMIVPHADESGNQRIIAFVIKKDQIAADAGLKEALAKYLEELLPKYMLPQDIVVVEEYPLLGNGKVNYRALLEMSVAERAIVAPATEMEVKILAIWKDILGDKPISTEEGFNEVGGDSLMIMRLIGRINRDCQVRMSLSDLFKHLTVKKQAAFVETAKMESLAVIPKAVEKECYPLYSPQKRLFFLHHYAKDSLAYNMPSVVDLEGELDVVRLRKAFLQLIERHENLRSAFILSEEGPVMVIAKDVRFEVEYFEADGAAVSSVIREFIRPFDLGVPNLLRVGLIRVSPERHTLVVDMHHIISDGLSHRILVRDFAALYDGRVLPSLRLQYKDFSEWQLGERQQRAVKAKKEFWIREFAELPEALSLSSRLAGSPDAGREGATVGFELGSDHVGRLKSLAEKNGATLFMALFSIFNILLSKLGNLEDIVVGTPAAGRHHPDMEDVVGMFVNTLPIRSLPKADMSFTAFLAAVKEKVVACFENQDYPYEELIDALQIEREAGRNPLFDVVFSYQRFGEEEFGLEGLKIRPVALGQDMAKFDLTLFVFEQGEKMNLVFEYAAKLFSKETIERFAGYFLRIVAAVTDNADGLLSDIELLTEEEQASLLERFDNTAVRYPEEETVVSLFEKQARQNPGSVALRFSGDQMTYGELDRRAEQVGVLLRDHGVRADEVVGLLMDRSMEVVIGMLGILKAGGAYMPIDVDQPEERKKYIIDDSGARIVLTSRKYDHAAAVGGTVLFIEDAEDIPAGPGAVSCGVRPADLCYVIYTSGTTGNPKGVMVEHRNVVRLLFNDEFQFHFDASDVWTMFHSPGFDFSVWEMYGALLFGGRLVIIPKAIARDTRAYLDILKVEGVTILNQTPSAFYNLVSEELADEKKDLRLRYVVFGGEALSPGRLKAWRAKYPRVKLVNMFGITETTVHVTYKEIGDEEIENNISNIGRPIPTLAVYIFNSAGRLAPAGVTGELLVGGAGVARGYLRKEELTRNKFIMNPYKPGERLYRSGDLARMLEGGDLEYIGRMDLQVKIRGFRIELGEIEVQLTSHRQIREAVVIDILKGGNKLLAAYYVSDAVIEGAALRHHLLERLPDYMVPAYFTRVEGIPLTSNGKLNRRALPAPQLGGEKEYVAPATVLEKRLVEIWSDILGVDAGRIGVETSFFELGGHSLNALTLTSRVFKELHAELSLAQVFKYPNIRGICRSIEGADKKRFTSIAKAAEKRYYALSSAQKRVYFLYEFERMSKAYNTPQVLRLEGELDKDKLQSALRKLLARHEGLRTSFELVNDEVLQGIVDEPPFAIEYFEPGESGLDAVVASFVRPFDLAKPPLLRVGLMPVSAAEHILMVDLHHIVSDGVSQGILIRDLMAFYDGREPAPLELTYKDFAEWQQQETQQRSAGMQREFWMEQFSEEVRVLDLPTDHPRPFIAEFNAGAVRFELNAAETKELRSIANREGATLFMLLLAAYTVLLSKLSGQDDIVVGIPTAGRLRPELDNVVGMFVNSLPLRNYPKGDLSFKSFLRSVSARTLACLNNQEFPYEELIDSLHLERDTGRNPLFDTMLAFQNFKQTRLEIPGLTISAVDLHASIAKFDITLFVYEMEGRLEFNLEYATELLKRDTAERFVEFFRRIISVVAADIDTKIADIAIIAGEEQDRIVHGFDVQQIRNSLAGVPEVADAGEYDLFRILDKNRQSRPVGIGGELYVGWQQGRPDHPANGRFGGRAPMPDPVSDTGVVYPTGLMAKWLPAGGIEILGKMSDPVRLKGKRIEQETNEAAPAGEIEANLIAIWSDVLKLDKKAVDVHATFFELGGNSMQAILLVNKIYRELGVRIPLKVLFENKDIVSLSEVIRASKRTAISSIRPAEKKEYYPASDAQKAMYLLYALDKSSLAYNQARVRLVEGPLDVDRLRVVFQELFVRHELFRTSFEIVGEEPVQRISDKIDFDLEFFKADEVEARAIIKRFIRPFDLRRAPLLRVGLIEIASQKHCLVLDTHHIILDGTSDALLVRELFALYNRELLPGVKLQYKDYAEWQQSHSHRKELERQKGFWLSQFREEMPVLALPRDFADPVPHGQRGGFRDVGIDKGQTAALRAIAAAENSSLFMVILTIYNIFLSKLVNQDDILIGTLVSGREHADLEHMMGMFVSTLPLRNHPAGNLSFRDFLADVRTNTLSCFENQAYQYKAPIHELNIERNFGQVAPYKAFFVHHNFERTPDKDLPELTFEAYSEDKTDDLLYDIAMVVVEEGKEIKMQIGCNRYFKRSTRERFAGYFMQVLERVIKDNNIRLADIGIIAEEEKSRMLYEFNDTGKAIDKDTPYYELFRRQAERTPLNIAVGHNGEVLSYRDLCDASGRLAGLLRSRGVKSNVRVALFLSRGIGMLTTILAVFGAGGAYVPIDVLYPEERVKEILADSEPELILTDGNSIHQIAELRRSMASPIEIIDIDRPYLQRAGDEEDRRDASIDDLAYMIYTSGSTGKPKGVMIHQLGMLNHLYAKIRDLGIDENDVIAQSASPCFDISVWQFLAALLVGGKTYIIDRDTVLTAEPLVRELQQGGVTIFESVPSLITAFLDGLREDQPYLLPRLRWMVPTGEALSVVLVKKWQYRFPDIELLNAYGPTEASDDITHYPVRELQPGASTVPIGRPVQNTHIYILDRNLRLCPVGVQGEICVAGLGVGKGYWKNEAETRRGFIPNPYYEHTGDPRYATMYKTGDIGYYTETGDIICLGRMDEQLKIRGFRIDPGEIEAVLMQHAGVKDAVVLTYNKGENDRRLAAFVVTTDHSITPPMLRQYLKGRLPDHMIPSVIGKIDKIPLTSNGKADKNALLRRLATADQVEENYVEPRTDLEKKLAQIWREVLGIDLVGLNDNFFELGGHSLLLIRSSERIRNKFHIEIPFRLYFDQTLEQIANEIGVRMEERLLI